MSLHVKFLYAVEYAMPDSDNRGELTGKHSTIVTEGEQDRSEATMKLKKGNPGDPKVTEAILEFLQQMTPEELVAFVTYRTPGVEETDMTGMCSSDQSARKPVVEKRPVAAK
ncbi:MAG: hypothetical protein JWL77_4768 [Chthonomonadaceae bacterium]|nr:hypothetical protein [Chthonomonadaceae bacterium]